MGWEISSVIVLYLNLFYGMKSITYASVPSCFHGQFSDNHAFCPANKYISQSPGQSVSSSLGLVGTNLAQTDIALPWLIRRDQD